MDKNRGYTEAIPALLAELNVSFFFIIHAWPSSTQPQNGRRGVANYRWNPPLSSTRNSESILPRQSAYIDHAQANNTTPRTFLKTGLHRKPSPSNSPSPSTTPAAKAETPARRTREYNFPRRLLSSLSPATHRKHRRLTRHKPETAQSSLCNAGRDSRKEDEVGNSQPSGEYGDKAARPQTPPARDVEIRD